MEYGLNKHAFNFVDGRYEKESMFENTATFLITKYIATQNECGQFLRPYTHFNGFGVSKYTKKAFVPIGTVLVEVTR